MNKRQKNFILNKLIPFIKREHGNGFCMNAWRDKYPKSEYEAVVASQGEGYYWDGVAHDRPRCGTVACIGGSTQLLSGGRKTQLHAVLGLTKEQASGLFYRWEVDNYYASTSWPRKFAEEFAAADTARKKASVAIRLLRKVVRTEGACLNNKAGD